MCYTPMQNLPRFQIVIKIREITRGYMNFDYITAIVCLCDSNTIFFYEFLLPKILCLNHIYIYNSITVIQYNHNSCTHGCYL